MYRRKRKNSKPIYYAMFKRSDGRFGSGVNTGCISCKEAEEWAINYIWKNGNEDNIGVFIPQKNNITFEDFTKGFFDWGREWATDKIVTGKRITQRQRKEKTAILDNRLIPKLGKMPISKIDKPIIKTFRNDLYQIEGLAGSTINKTLSRLKVILESAEEKSLIQYIPKIERASAKGEQRGIMTVDEVKQIRPMGITVNEIARKIASDSNYTGILSSLFLYADMTFWRDFARE